MDKEEVIVGLPGLCVAMGLGKPVPRGVCAGLLAGAVAYALQYPKSAFTRDGRMRPVQSLSTQPGGVPWAQHFLMIPLAVGTGVALFT